MKIPSPSLIVSTVALVFALGGTGYAVTALPKNSVGTTQIKNSAVTGAKIKNSAVTGAKIKNGTIESADLASGVSVSGAVGATGATGAVGATGPTASAMARTTSTKLLAAGATVDVIRLTTASTNSGALTLTTTMRVVVNASVNISKSPSGSNSSYGYASCEIQYAPDGSSSFTSIGATAGLSFLTTSVDGTAVHGTLPVTDAITLAAGTWDFKVQCSAASSPSLGISALIATQVSFTAVATAV